MSSKDDAKKKDVHEIKIEGTMTDVEIAPEFLEWAGYKNHKKSSQYGVDIVLP